MGPGCSLYLLRSIGSKAKHLLCSHEEGKHNQHHFFICLLPTAVTNIVVMESVGYLSIKGMVLKYLQDHEGEETLSAHSLRQTQLRGLHGTGNPGGRDQSPARQGTKAL